ncbi:hypothetical protein [Actinophytocola gossypii]|uniref:WXG100 family type VII secretion target n=1 Tax=Actinophytocola gossypii TaxID=2812003 RepID=A0ABT2J9C1_9PSEU|nr:hypothetical protein [Actinophytocola gossypii]MCT2584466.1 hypothetical protein [Actinophytocola gossypii]
MAQPVCKAVQFCPAAGTLGSLDALEDAWKSQVKQLSWAADTINDTANRVIGGEAWMGETAQRYDQHRRKLVDDLDRCAELTGKVARALGNARRHSGTTRAS